jgi:hypothetical protein
MGHESPISRRLNPIEADDRAGLVDQDLVRRQGLILRIENLDVVLIDRPAGLVDIRQNEIHGLTGKVLRSLRLKVGLNRISAGPGKSLRAHKPGNQCNDNRESLHITLLLAHEISDLRPASKVKHWLGLERHLSPLGLLLSQLIASLAEMNLHGVPIEPVTVPLSEDLTALKALKSIFGQFALGWEHASRPLH